MLANGCRQGYFLFLMSDVTQILNAIEQGDPKAAEQLLPLVYDELRQLAAQKLARETPGQTLQATALVHEAYVRLVGSEKGKSWDGRGHFFAAAAEAMRRILIDSARHKAALKHGDARKRVDLESAEVVSFSCPNELLVIDDALDKLAREDPEAAQLVKLKFYGGFSVAEAAELMGVSRTTAYEHWNYARAWLHFELHGQEPKPEA
jgi:RNA polymerase sigma factor (TIGR02999 family)